MSTRTKKAPRRSHGSPSAQDLVRQGTSLINARSMRDVKTYGHAIKNAERIFRQAIGKDSQCPEAWSALGCLLIEQRLPSEAVSCFRRALDIWRPMETAPASTEDTSKTPHEAIELLLAIASLKPDWAPVRMALGSAYGGLSDYTSAIAHYREALRIDPTLEGPIQSVLTRMHVNEGRWEEGLEAANRSLAADPGNALVLLARARALFAIGRIAESVEDERRGFETVFDPVLHSGLITKMCLLPETTPEVLYAEARRWDARYVAPLASSIRPHTNTPDPDRRLKVGYVSPDLYNHAVSKFIPPVFQWHDRSQFEVFVYQMGTKSDMITDHLRNYVENWVPLPNAGSECADRFRADGIDILVNLAGHTLGPAHLAFAVKPAPVQVVWLGFLCTTGMSTMDYFMGDAHMPCPGTEHLFSEQVYRLPVQCCYRPIGEHLVWQAPCRERGYITFGSFNNPRKITRDVAKLWSAILHSVPNSRLMLKFHELEKEESQAGLKAWFAEDGIPSERLVFGGATAMNEYPYEYNLIDIALDPFPYNGGTTTLDALWMGVPVVTLAGRLSVQCGGASLLRAVGLDDSVAETPEEYIRIALWLAETVSKIPELRQNVRQAFLNSPLRDEIGFVHSLESAYRDMWRRWCQTRCV